MPINPPPKYPRPTLSLNGSTLLAPGEAWRPLAAIAAPTDCEGCGAPLQRHLASCSWCTRPTRAGVRILAR